MRTRRAHIPTYFFLLVFVGFYCSITFFNHTHIVDGDTIVHSHPFKSDRGGNPSHNHSSGGYLLVHFITDFTAALPFILIINIFRYLNPEVLFGSFASFFARQVNGTDQYRGPPEVILI